MKPTSQRKTRIAFFAEILLRDFDGATRTVYQIIDRIDTTNFEVLFFCGVLPTQNFPFEIFHVPAITIPFNKDYQVASVFRMGSKIEEKLNSFAPDVIHITTPAPLGFYAMKYAKRKQIPTTTIYHTHFISYIKYYTGNSLVITTALEKLLKIHNRSFYNNCSLVLVPTAAIKQELRELDIRGKQMDIWPRGIDTTLFHPSKRNVLPLQRLTGNTDRNILFASRLVWEKNLNTLVKIHNQIREEKLPYNLIIAGDGIAKKELQELMPEAYFIGHQNHASLSTVYASCDYFIFTSVTETFGNVIIEAQASGLPCIIADGGGSKSLISQGINGFLCNPNDASDFISKINLLETQPTLRSLIIQHGLESVQRLGWAELVEDFFLKVDDIASQKTTKKIVIPPSAITQPSLAS